MPDIPAGATGTRQMEVTSEVAISFLENDKARVLATPWLITFLEWTARDLIKPYLLDGEDSVGTQVNVTHLAASPLGMRVRFIAEVLQVTGRRVLFRVEAADDLEKICEGTHERFVVDVARFAQRAEEKRQRQDSLSGKL